MNKFITAMSTLDDPCSLQLVPKPSVLTLFVYLCFHPQIGVKERLRPGKVKKLVCAFIHWVAIEGAAEASARCHVTLWVCADPSAIG